MKLSAALPPMLEQAIPPIVPARAVAEPHQSRLQEELVIAVFQGLRGLEQIRRDWDSITERMTGRRHYFHLWEWHRQYLETLADEPDSALFHVAYRASVPVAVLPLRSTTMRQAGFTLKVLELPFHKHMSLSDMICDPAPGHADIPRLMMAHLRSDCRKDWDVIVLRGLLAESSSLGRGWAELPGPLIRVARDRCDSLRHATPEAMLATVSKNFRNNLRKARNKLAQLPEASFEFVRDPALLPAAFEHFLRVEASGWKGAGGTGTAIGLDPQLRSFYEKVMESSGASGHCQINLLMLGDRCVAGQFCLRLDGTLYILKIGYAENQAQIAPGNMLLEECLRRSSAEPDPIHCWNLISGVAWHDDWKPTSEAVSDLWLYNRTPRGLASYGWTVAAQYCRSVCRNLKNRRQTVQPAPKRTSAGAGASAEA